MFRDIGQNWKPLSHFFGCIQSLQISKFQTKEASKNQDSALSHTRVSTKYTMLVDYHGPKFWSPTWYILYMIVYQHVNTIIFHETSPSFTSEVQQARMPTLKLMQALTSFHAQRLDHPKISTETSQTKNEKMMRTGHMGIVSSHMHRHARSGLQICWCVSPWRTAAVRCSQCSQLSPNLTKRQWNIANQQSPGHLPQPKGRNGRVHAAMQLRQVMGCQNVQLQMKSRGKLTNTRLIWCHHARQNWYCGISSVQYIYFDIDSNPLVLSLAWLLPCLYKLRRAASNRATSFSKVLNWISSAV